MVHASLVYKAKRVSLDQQAVETFESKAWGLVRRSQAMSQSSSQKNWTKLIAGQQTPSTHLEMQKVVRLMTLAPYLCVLEVLA